MSGENKQTPRQDEFSARVVALSQDDKDLLWYCATQHTTWSSGRRKGIGDVNVPAVLQAGYKQETITSLFHKLGLPSKGPSYGLPRCLQRMIL